MTKQPTSPVVGFIYSDPVDPGAQAAIAAEAADVAKNFQKNFLSNITGVRPIVEEAIGEIVNGALKALNQLFISVLISSLETGDQAMVLDAASCSAVSVELRFRE